MVRVQFLLTSQGPEIRMQKTQSIDEELVQKVVVLQRATSAPNLGSWKTPLNCLRCVCVFLNIFHQICQEVLFISQNLSRFKRTQDFKGSAVALSFQN